MKQILMIISLVMAWSAFASQGSDTHGRQTYLSYHTEGGRVYAQKGCFLRI